MEEVEISETPFNITFHWVPFDNPVSVKFTSKFATAVAGLTGLDKFELF
ncbi:MAG: hypothetical protein ACYDBK_08985 [Thermoplasmataceae archaeon]